MTLVQTNHGRDFDQPASYVDMKYALHYVPLGQKLPESYVICTKVADESGPPEYVAHLYMYNEPGPQPGRVSTAAVYAALRDVYAVGVTDTDTREGQ